MELYRLSLPDIIGNQGQRQRMLVLCHAMKSTYVGTTALYSQNYTGMLQCTAVKLVA